MTVGPDAPLFTYSEWDAGVGDVAVHAARDGGVVIEIAGEEEGTAKIHLDRETVHTLGNVLLTHYWRQSLPQEP